MTVGTTLAGPRCVLAPLEPAHAEALREIRRRPEVLRWWRPLEPDFPLDDDSESVRWTVLLKDDAGAVDPRPRGMIQYFEEDEPDYRHAGMDVFLDPSAGGRGLGREVVAVLARHLVTDRGHHRLTIDPAADNAAAIACYAAVGFRPVGRMRRYERGSDGTWHDGLLMDALAEELVAPEDLTRR
jgi:aminoglycoside 6'-N-acetyltransferase